MSTGDPISGGSTGTGGPMRGQTEDQFSDGTLRLLGLLWSLMDGTAVSLASSQDQIRVLLESGLAMGDVVLPRTALTNAEQLSLLFNDPQT